MRYWKDAWQAALWDQATVETMQGHLDDALAATEHFVPVKDAGLSPDRFRERVQQTTDLFSLTRAFLQFMESSWELQAGDWEEAGGKDLSKGLELADKALKARQALIERSRSVKARHPNTQFAHDLSWVFRYDDIGASLAAIRAGMARKQWGPEDDYRKADRLLEEWTTAHGMEGLPEFNNAEQVLHDTDFSEAADPEVWRHQSLDSEGLQMGPDPRGIGYVAENVRRGHIYQVFEVKPRHYYLGLLDLASMQTPSGEVYIRLDFFKEGTLLAKSTRGKIAPVGRYGSEQRIRTLMQAPAEATHGRIMIRFYELEEDRRVYLKTVNVLDLGYRPTP